MSKDVTDDQGEADATGGRFGYTHERIDLLERRTRNQVDRLDRSNDQISARLKVYETRLTELNDYIAVLTGRLNAAEAVEPTEVAWRKEDGGFFAATFDLKDTKAKSQPQEHSTGNRFVVECPPGEVILIKFSQEKPHGDEYPQTETGPH